MTKFQSKLINDIDTLWEIVKIFHPDIPERITFTNKRNEVRLKNVKDLIKPWLKYQWVGVTFKVKDYGNVSFGMENGSHPFSGQGITREDFADALKNKKCKIRGWRFCDDKVQGETVTCSPEYEALSNKVSNHLLVKGYQLQSVSEMYDYYYKD